jgi:hypothetical protein
MKPTEPISFMTKAFITPPLSEIIPSNYHNTENTAGLILRR